MKKLILLLTFTFLILSVSAQTYLKVSDKPEYAKYLAYCNTPVSRPFTVQLRVDLRKVNGTYMDSTGNWYVSKIPPLYLYKIGTQSITLNDNQKLISLQIYLPVRRREPSIADFYANWKTRFIQEGLIDERSGIK